MVTRSRTIEVAIPAPSDLQEYLIAELLDLDFEAFLQDDDVLTAYIPPPRWNDVTREAIEHWLRVNGIHEPIKEQVVEPRNWNEAWEETIQPVSAPPFLIKPTWAAIPEGEEGRIVLEIDPKMSFGTGYHETTRLMLGMMPKAVREGDVVLDAGTGTGVLAIGALRLGAASALGFDIDEWAFDNAGENALINGVADRFSVRIGDLDVVGDFTADVIFANIHLSVLIEMMPEFKARLRKDGRLLLSGVLRTDRDAMLESIAQNGLELVDEAFEGDWWALLTRRA
jgi:ribosomal protein L11 methyltransferase